MFAIWSKHWVLAGSISQVSAQLSLVVPRAWEKRSPWRLPRQGPTWWLPPGRPEEAQKVAGEIEALGRRTLPATVDIRDRSSIEALQQKVLETFRKVDILVNAAGITLKTPTLDCSEEGWNNVIDINLNGTWRCCQIFGKTMVSQGFGKILNIASLSTFRRLQPGCCLRGQQSGCRRAHQVAGDRTRSPQHMRECALLPASFPPP